MSFSTMIDAIKATVRAATGRIVPSTIQTEWDSQNQNHVNTDTKQKVRLSISAVETLGRDYVRERFVEGDPDALPEPVPDQLVGDIRGQRSFRLTVVWETYNLTAGGSLATEHLDLLVLYLRNDPAFSDAFRDAGCCIADATDVQDASFVFDDRITGAAYVELLCNTNREIEGTGDIGWIEIINAEADIRGESPAERPPENWQLAPKE